MSKHNEWMRIYQRTWPYLERTALTLAHEENDALEGDPEDLARAAEIVHEGVGTPAELIECCARIMLRARARLLRDEAQRAERDPTPLERALAAASRPVGGVAEASASVGVEASD